MKTINILVAEDNEHDFKKISRAFRKCDFEVNITHCVRAEKILELLEQDNSPDSYDILLTDFMMPGMTGLELVEKLFQQKSLFPIILLTGEGDENIAVKALKLGVSDYLSKDMNSHFVELLPEAVLKAIQSYTDKQALNNAEAQNRILSAALQQSHSAIAVADLKKNISVRYKSIKSDLLPAHIKSFFIRLTSGLDDTESWINSIVQDLVGCTLKEISDIDYDKLKNRFETSFLELDHLVDLHNVKLRKEQEIFRIEFTTSKGGDQAQQFILDKGAQEKADELADNLLGNLSSDINTNKLALIKLLRKISSK